MDSIENRTQCSHGYPGFRYLSPEFLLLKRFGYQLLVLMLKGTTALFTKRNYMNLATDSKARLQFTELVS